MKELARNNGNGLLINGVSFCENFDPGVYFNPDLQVHEIEDGPKLNPEPDRSKAEPYHDPDDIDPESEETLFSFLFKRRKKVLI
jgi:hypothetical protein